MRERRPRGSRRPPGSGSAAFDRIRADRRHGAHVLATEALKVLSRQTRDWSGQSESALRRRIREVARALDRTQPAMGPFLRWAAEWRAMARSPAGHRLKKTARAWVQRERDGLRVELPRILRTSRRRFPKAGLVVTLSRSQSVLAALRSAPSSRRPERILVLESRPGGEGRRFARELRQAGLPARTIPDAKGGDVVRSAGLVLIGADAIFSDGSVVHKVGTLRLARAAARAGVPVVVVAGRSKFTGRRPPRRRLPALFDRTPVRYVSEFWTDRGVRRGRSRFRVRPQRSPL
jgi:translation initiation factor 2B subunit (eIF-2B alpha/beta/delta family)